MKLIITILSLLFVTSNVNSQTYGKDDNKYRICYGEMTKAHKARGYHQSNRAMSIKVKEERLAIKKKTSKKGKKSKK